MRFQPGDLVRVQTFDPRTHVRTPAYVRGKHAEALTLSRKVLEVRKKTLGEQHLSTAASYNNAASCLQAQGKLAEALSLYRKALRIFKKVRGQEHPDTAAYTAPEIVQRIRKRHHAGLIVASPDAARVSELLDEHVRRFYADFHASVPAPDRPID